MSARPGPGKIVCVGLSYRAHAREQGIVNYGDRQWTRGKSFDRVEIEGIGSVTSPVVAAEP